MPRLSTEVFSWCLFYHALSNSSTACLFQLTISSIVISRAFGGVFMMRRITILEACCVPHLPSHSMLCTLYPRLLSFLLISEIRLRSSFKRISEKMQCHAPSRNMSTILCWSGPKWIFMVSLSGRAV